MGSHLLSKDLAKQSECVSVDLGARSYDILIGRDLLKEAGRLISGLRPDAKCAIVTDENVAEHHLNSLMLSLEASGVQGHNIILPAGESSKSYETLSTLLDALLETEIERGDLVIALGGGVIGDLAGFAASVLRRGVDFVQIPTSLLAQVDSSVGGKTGINSSYGKNLIGAFHQPLLVLCDLDVLKTLDPRQFRAGYAEVVKYGLIRDTAFFSWLSENRNALYSHDTEALIRAVKTSCQMKADVVSRDEKEHGVRALLNLGHTFGHAFESLTGYSDKLLHGEAISIGMVMAFQFSERLGFTAPGRAAIVKAHFEAAQLPTTISDVPALQAYGVEDIALKMRQDKKVERGHMVFILTHDIGDAFVCRDVDPADLEAFLGDML